MKKYLIISLLTILSSCTVNDKSLDNLNNAQSFLDNIITNPEKAKSLLHNDFSFAWMGIIEQGGKLWNKENLFNEYFATIIPEILPNGIILKTVDSISDENGVAIIQVGDAEGKNGEYDNNYVWVFKFKDGLIYELREYNSDLLVAERLYDYKLIKLD
jgi:ketosteroid isomerase-like protein|tara:strand:- start:2499 stop:2972 length:474 start_codon:yes stop_codon:yes gene_type:complete